jgi:hypothetical protein
MIQHGFDHGFPPKAWKAAKAEAKEILKGVARRRSIIAYSDLAAMISSVQMTAHDRRYFHFLGEVSAEEDEAGRGLLTVLVVHKSGDMKPGPGFFELAEGRGRDVSDLDQCWVEELNDVHEVWARRS